MVKGILNANVTKDKQTLENRVAAEKGTETWLDKLIQVGKKLVSGEIKEEHETVNYTPDMGTTKEMLAISGHHYVGIGRKIADTKDRQMEYIVADAKEMLGRQMQALAMSSAKAMFLKADIKDWDDNGKPLNGCIEFDIAFQAPTGDPRTISADMVLENGTLQEPQIFKDGVKEYAFSKEGVKELLEGTDFELMQNPKVKKEDTFFENPGHLASARGGYAIHRAGYSDKKMMERRAAIKEKIVTARLGQVRPINKEAAGKDKTMEVLTSAGRFQFKHKSQPAPVGGNQPWHSESTIPYEQFGVNENDPNALASVKGVEKKADTLNIEQYLDVNEFKELQNLQQMADNMWNLIREREKLNERKGLSPYTNIDYSDIKLVDKQVENYKELAKVRAEKPETQIMTEERPTEHPELKEEKEKSKEGEEDIEMEEEKPMLTPEKGKGRPDLVPPTLPEFASAKGKMAKVAKGFTSNDFKKVLDVKTNPYCPICNIMLNYVGDNKYTCPAGCFKGPMEYQEMEDISAAERSGRAVERDSYGGDKELVELFEHGDVEIKDMTKKAITSWDTPRVCQNCKKLITPVGYSELTEIDMHRKPFCGAIAQGKNIGFEFACFRGCEGYEAIAKDIPQEVEINVYKKPYQLWRKSNLEKEKAMVRKGGEEQYKLECPQCGTLFPVSEYGPNRCPECGSRVNHTEPAKMQGQPMKHVKIKNTTLVREEPITNVMFDPEREYAKPTAEQTVGMKKKANMDKIIAQRKAEQKEMLKKIAYEGEDASSVPECGACKDCIPAGEGQVSHDYCKVWQTSCSNIVVLPSGACVPITMAGQSAETLQKSTSMFSRGLEV